MNLTQTDIALWQFPVSLLAGVAFLLLLWVLHRYYAQSRVVIRLSATTTALSLIGITAVTLMVEGIFGWELFHTLPFLLMLLFLLTSLGLTLLRCWKNHGWGFRLNHAGLFLILWGALFGVPDRIEARMTVGLGGSEQVATDRNGDLIPLPFPVTLNRFTVDRYDNGMPRQFRSELNLGDRTATVSVNHPARYQGYKFYQESYETHGNVATLLLVKRDPWLPVVWAGILLLAVGSIFLLLRP